MVDMHTDWDPSLITIDNDTVSDSWKVCIIDGVFQSENEYNGSLGARISSIFVIFFVSTFLTLFPLLAQRMPRLRIPLYVYLFARYFGVGVIVATAFIHLLDPAYDTLGGRTCVGRTGNWGLYSWVPAIILVSIFAVFLLDVFMQVIVERKFGVHHDHSAGNKEVETAIIRNQANTINNIDVENTSDSSIRKERELATTEHVMSEAEIEHAWRQEFGAFLLLEFGVIFHSVLIGLNLGAVGDEFKTLYIVLVFNQSFEGLGIGARLSAIPWPASKPTWIPWACCLSYGLVTPVSIAIGLGVRTTYMSESYNANIVQGILNAISSGLLIYNGLVELLARDFIFDHNRTKDLGKLVFNLSCVILGAGIMSLIGKWA